MFRYIKKGSTFERSNKKNFAMKIISKANNKNNSRLTIEFKENGILSKAEGIAKKYSCGFSHNVHTEVGTNTPKSFGTISFNKGEHIAALNEFLK